MPTNQFLGQPLREGCVWIAIYQMVFSTIIILHGTFEIAELNLSELIWPPPPPEDTETVLIDSFGVGHNYEETTSPPIIASRGLGSGKGHRMRVVPLDNKNPELFYLVSKYFLVVAGIVNFAMGVVLIVAAARRSELICCIWKWVNLLLMFGWTTYLFAYAYFTVANIWWVGAMIILILIHVSQFLAVVAFLDDLREAKRW